MFLEKANKSIQAKPYTQTIYNITKDGLEKDTMKGEMELRNKAVVVFCCLWVNSLL